MTNNSTSESKSNPYYWMLHKRQTTPSPATSFTSLGMISAGYNNNIPTSFVQHSWARMQNTAAYSLDTSSLRTGVDEPASTKVEVLILLPTANPIYTCSSCLEDELVLHQYLTEKTKGLKRLGHITTWILAEWKSNIPFVTADCALTHPVSHKTRNCVETVARNVKNFQKQKPFCSN